MSSPAKVSIIGKVVEVITDRSTYKNYQPKLTFDDLYVEFLVPKEHVSQTEKGGYIVTFEGFAKFILDPFCTAIDDMHQNWKEQEQQRLEKAEAKSMRRRS